jgi:hypothetical protein
MKRHLCSVLLLAAILIAPGCGVLASPLPGGHASPEALVTALLSRLAMRDVQGLRALAITEEEFREHVWPELPAARPERNLPFSYVWGDLHQKSETSLARTLATHGGRRYAFVAIEYLDGTTPYRSYLVHRQAVVTVRDEAGALRRLRLFGSVLSKGNRLKVFSFVVD